jgi:hypothetical protein
MTPAEAAAALPGHAEKEVETVRKEIAARTPRAANELRNAELQVLNNPAGSAPGNPPGRRSSTLWRADSWEVTSSASSIVLSTGVHYAGYLEHGTRKMAARPFVDRIQQQALPRIISIFQEIGG